MHTAGFALEVSPAAASASGAWRPAAFPGILLPMDRKTALARLSVLLPELRARFGVRELAVFGSVARDEATDASDLDLIVDFDGPATFDAFMGLKLFLEDTLTVRVDLATRPSLKSRLKARVEAEALRVA